MVLISPLILKLREQNKSTWFDTCLTTYPGTTFTERLSVGPCGTFFIYKLGKGLPYHIGRITGEGVVQDSICSYARLDKAKRGARLLADGLNGWDEYSLMVRHGQ